MKKLFFVLLSSALLMGCAAIPLTPNGAQVKLIDHQKPTKSCHYIGPVSASDSGWNIEDSVISNKTLIEDSLNELRNAAAKEHANCVQVMHYHDTNTSIMGWVGYARQPEVVGVAYCCPNSQTSVAAASQQATKYSKSTTTPDLQKKSANNAPESLWS